MVGQQAASDSALHQARKDAEMEQASDHRDAAARFRYVMTRVWRFIVKHKYPLVLLVINLIVFHKWFFNFSTLTYGCLLYTSDAADDLLCVDLGGRRIIKKKKKKT